MRLQDYIHTFKTGSSRHKERQRIANVLNVSESYIRAMANDNFSIPLWIACSLEKITRGKVTVNDCSPMESDAVRKYLDSLDRLHNKVK